MAKNDDQNLKDDLLDYYERLVTFLLQKIGGITDEYDDDAKGRLVAAIALDFAAANSKDIDWFPEYALQYVRAKGLGLPADYDAGRYSAQEDGFNFLTYCCDICETLGYSSGRGLVSPVEEKADEILSNVYDKRVGWTASLVRTSK